MLTPDVRFEGWTPTEWGRFLSLWKVVEPGSRPDVDLVPRGGLILVHADGRIRKALHTEGGRIDPNTIVWPAPLGAVAHEARAAWAWSLHSGALEELMERFAARLRRGDDMLDQLLVLFRAFRELIEEGGIESWPRRLKSVPVPTRAVLDRALDGVLPAGRAAALAFYDEGELWTAIVLRRAAGSPARFDVVAGPSELRREMGVLSGDFRRDYRHFVDAVEALYAPMAVSLHAEVSTFRALITMARPGDWARSVALRDVVLRPLPPLLAVPLGLDATRGAVEVAGKMARRLDPLGVLRQSLRVIASVLPALPAAEAAGGVPRFSPLEVLRRVLTR